MEGRLAQRDGREDRGSGEGAGRAAWVPGGEVTGGCPFQGPPGLLAAEVRLRDRRCCHPAATSPGAAVVPKVKLGHQVRSPGGRWETQGPWVCLSCPSLNTLLKSEDTNRQNQPVPRAPPSLGTVGRLLRGPLRSSEGRVGGSPVCPAAPPLLAAPAGPRAADLTH